MMKAIIVGATSGIGRAITDQLTQKGWQVGIAGRRIGVLQEIQSRNINILATQEIDVTTDNAVDGLN
ncbi:MAG: SDR family NAD(P)-dependent oxidoreductase, partial [Bacteroidaceae bacterium]|nr:SDR family NAD(P)-dependent oxidoreductase [Bacteroidaceae bacterium]